MVPTRTSARHLDGVTQRRGAATPETLLALLAPRHRRDPPDAARHRDRLREVPLPLRERARGQTPRRPASLPRKAASTIYLADGVGAHASELARLGPHTTGVGCLYVKDLDDVDLGVLEGIVASSYASVRDGTYALPRPRGHRDLRTGQAVRKWPQSLARLSAWT